MQGTVLAKRGSEYGYTLYPQSLHVPFSSLQLLCRMDQLSAFAPLKSFGTVLPYPSALSTLTSSQLDQARTDELGGELDGKPLQHQHPQHLHNLAVTVLHNLRHQHDWTSLRIHTHSPISSSQSRSSPEVCTDRDPRESSPLLLRPLVSGLPPQRLYLHPEDQIALIAADKRARLHMEESGDIASEQPWIGKLRRPRREWVLPTQLREKWSLRQFAEVFDSIELEPSAANSSNIDIKARESHHGGGEGKARDPSREHETGEGPLEGLVGQVPEDSSRYEGSKDEVKRLLLATVNDDSTIVYYIVHDGIVKPRQN